MSFLSIVEVLLESGQVEEFGGQKTDSVVAWKEIC